MDLISREPEIEKRKEESAQNVSKEDLISRKAAIDAVNGVIADYIPTLYGRYEALPLEMATAIKRLPTAEPTLYGYKIEHLAYIARVMQKEGVTAEYAVRTFGDISRASRMIIEELQEKVEKSLSAMQLPSAEPEKCTEEHTETHACDCISRQAAIDEINKLEYPSSLVDVKRIIVDLPSAQPEIVRCKDCANWIPGYVTDNDDFIPPKCGKYQQMVGHSSNDYCSQQKGEPMKITMSEKTTTIEADARELRESNTLADNFAMMLSRCFRSNEKFEDDENEEAVEDEATD